MNSMAAPGGHPAGKSLARVALATFALLLMPAVAMFFTDEVNWGPGDFLVAAVLLGGTGLLLEFAVKRLHTQKSRVIAGGAIVMMLLFVWAELAVGIVGSPFAGS
jgi:hypothetical protein